MKQSHDESKHQTCEIGDHSSSLATESTLSISGST
jgi:hypothetical protein